MLICLKKGAHLLPMSALLLLEVDADYDARERPPHSQEVIFNKLGV